MSGTGLGPWADGLQPASWNGVWFAVRSSQIRRGRRVAVHEYPFKDDVWVEDLGRGTRIVSFNGFLIGDDVFAQRDDMVAAAETPGPGSLVHPSLGAVTASLTEFSAGERWDLGRVVELEMSFIQAGQDAPEYPSAEADTQAATDDAADNADDAFAQDYGDDAAPAVSKGQAPVKASTKTVQTFCKQPVSMVSDGSTAANSTSGIGASIGNADQNYGRYSTIGLTSSPTLQLAQPQGSMVAQSNEAIGAAIDENVAAQQNVLTAQNSAIAAAAGL